MEYSSQPNILIVRTDRIGDVLLTLPLIDAVKKNEPSAKVAMLVQEYTRSLVETHPQLSATLTIDTKGKKKSFFSLVQEIRSHRFTAALVAYPRFRIAAALWCARVPVRIGTGYRWYSFLFNRKVYEHRKYATKHEAEYNLSLLRPLGYMPPQEVRLILHLTEEEKEKGRMLRRSIGIGDGERVVVLHPGSGGSARDWKKERFAELASELSRQALQVVITGTEKERTLVEEVVKLSGGTARPFISTHTLREFAAFLQTVNIVVANSTGPLHIAAAVGCAVVGFYPPVAVMSPTRWGPLTERKALFVPDPQQCSLCRGKKCRGNECMDQIQVQDVVRAVQELLHT